MRFRAIKKHPAIFDSDQLKRNENADRRTHEQRVGQDGLVLRFYLRFKTIKLGKTRKKRSTTWKSIKN